MNQEGKRYLGTLEQSQGGPLVTFKMAVLESRFQIEGPEISLAVSGGTGTDTTRFLLLEGKELESSRPNEVFSTIGRRRRGLRLLSDSSTAKVLGVILSWMRFTQSKISCLNCPQNAFAKLPPEANQ